MSIVNIQRYVSLIQERLVAHERSLNTCLPHIVSIAAKCSAVEVGRISSCYHVYRDITSCHKIEGVILGT
jgi:hypothetical protein